jgi:hypothetical protein
LFVLSFDPNMRPYDAMSLSMDLHGAKHETPSVGGPKNGSSESACRAARLYTEQVFTGVNSKSAWRAARLQSSCTGVHSRTRQRSAMVLTMKYANDRSDGD